MMVKLGEIITQIRGVSYKPSDVRAAGDPDAVALLRANNIQEDGLNFDDLVWVDKQKVGAEQYLRLGDILICSSSGSKGLVGKAAIVTSDLSCAFGAFCKVVRTKAEYASYLGQFFRSPRYRKEISASAAGANINNIRNEHIDEMFISMPSANERAGCVAKLGQIDYLIQKINNQSHQLDQLVKSRFVEMFGEMHSRVYETKKLRGFCKFQQGTQVPIEEQIETQLEGYTRFLRIIDYTQAPQPPRYVSVKGKKIEEDSVVVVRYGATAGFVGHGYAGILANNLFEVIPDEATMSKEFLYLTLKHGTFEQEVHDKAFGAAMPALSFGMMNDIIVAVPSKQAQNEFIVFVKQVDKSKLAVKQSLEKLETLKKSLMQQYFG